MLMLTLPIASTHQQGSHLPLQEPLVLPPLKPYFLVFLTRAAITVLHEIIFHCLKLSYTWQKVLASLTPTF